jgi:hypothetical protein
MIGGLFAPIFFLGGGQAQLDRAEAEHFKLNATLRALDDLAYDGALKLKVGAALNTSGSQSCCCGH